MVEDPRVCLPAIQDELRGGHEIEIFRGEAEQDGKKVLVVNRFVFAAAAKLETVRGSR